MRQTGRWSALSHLWTQRPPQRIPLSLDTPLFPNSFSSRPLAFLPGRFPSTHPGWPATCSEHQDPCTDTWPHLPVQAYAIFLSRGRTGEAEAQSTSLGTKGWGQWSQERLGSCQVPGDSETSSVGPGLPCFPSIPSPGFTISLLLWQCLPVKCSGQMQCGSCSMFIQVPPFWQGLCLLQWSERWTQ